MYSHLAPLSIAVVPARGAREISAHPRWLLSFVLIVFLSGVVEVVFHPVRVDQTVACIPASATGEERTTVRAELDAALAGNISILPLRIAAPVIVEAVLLALFLAGFGAADRPRFAHLFALCLGTAGIGVLEALAEVTYLWSLAVPQSMPAFPWSALAQVPGGQPYTTGLLLTSINLFTLWYVVALGWALSVLCSIRKSKAVLIVIVVRAVTAGCTIALLHLLRNAYAFTI